MLRILFLALSAASQVRQRLLSENELKSTAKQYKESAGEL